jgi:hypothetical protein
MRGRVGDRSNDTSAAFTPNRSDVVRRVVSGGSARESNPPIHRSREDPSVLKTEASTSPARASAAERTRKRAHLQTVDDKSGATAAAWRKCSSTASFTAAP